MLDLPVSITESARSRIAELTDAATWLRLDLKKGGCAGMEYSMECVSEREETDLVPDDGTRLAIAPRAQMFLLGTEIDYETDLLSEGFRFRNPNVTESCGCGESVAFG